MSKTKRRRISADMESSQHTHTPPGSASFLTPARRRSLTGALAGLGVGAGLAFVFSAWIGPVARETALALALFVPGAVVFVLVLAVAAGRFLTQAFDPFADAASPSRYMAITQRALSNSMEQGVIFATAGTALVVAGGPEAGTLTAALAATYAVARLAFWLGYLHSMFGRAPGMAATLGINLVLVTAAAAAILG